MKFKSLLLIAASIPTLAFAQNYQTQYLTGTYFDQAYDRTANSGAGAGQMTVNEDLTRHQFPTSIDRPEMSQGQVAKTQDGATHNMSPQNFNESAPKVGR